MSLDRESLQREGGLYQASKLGCWAAVGRLEEFEQAGRFILGSRYDIGFSSTDGLDGELLFHTRESVGDLSGSGKSK